MNKFFDNQQIREFSNLELLANQVVEGFIIGLHKSPFHGFSVEFAEHRIYNQGESTKNIDWKVFARTDKLFSKKFEEETNLRCHIVLDASSSMYFPTKEKQGDLDKMRFSILATAALMNLLKRQRDAFGLTIFDSEIRTHTADKSSGQHYQLLLSYLEKLLQEGKHGKSTSAAATLHQVADSIHKRSLVIIFSDMFENISEADELFSALQHLKYAKHEVVLFHVSDKSKELEFEYENRPYLFVDLETGEKIKLQSNEVKSFYKENMQKYLHQLKLKCMQFKIDLVEADINEGFKPILQSYLLKRSKMSV
ncbi:MAG TPA: DUF58 domain-containing protein [Saprospiraceae bacterium]|nr:DUF58 domain-containing protein [Saprospiraceae bacterium]MCC6689794.1 DUF58 domain-containing protein [Saprospiraceae bacterium]HMX83024.1 DUF58 domain-containing protein [Saprospiraceae bacterium]HMX85225.1 DUF58 domain-containing protein [Saprospiraceae bacterium]HMZ72824.1 DUF58 domain-containing protein [Saprospiraceae bacterium]